MAPRAEPTLIPTTERVGSEVDDSVDGCAVSAGLLDGLFGVETTGALVLDVLCVVEGADSRPALFEVVGVGPAPGK